MARLFSYNGKTYSAPDDATDDQISEAVLADNKPATWTETMRAVPGAIKREFGSLAAGGAQLLGDISGSEKLQEGAALAKAGIAGEAAEETPKNQSILQEGVTSGLASAAAQVPTMLATAPLAAPATLGRAFALSTTMMGAQTGVSRYGDERAAGFSPMRAGTHALFEGLVEKYTEYFPLKDLVGGNIVWRTARNYLGKELAGEEVATLLQDMSAKLSDRPDMTLGDYLRDVATTAVAVPVAGAAQLGAAKGLQVAGQAITPTPSPITPPPGVPPTPPPPAPPAVPPAPVPPVPPGPAATSAPTPPSGVAPPVEQVAAVAPAPQVDETRLVPGAAQTQQTTLFVDLNGTPQTTESTHIDHGTYLESKGVDNTAEAVAGKGWIYVDTSAGSDKPLLVAGADMYPLDTVKQAAAKYSALINAPVQVAYDEDRFVVERPTPPSPQGRGPEVYPADAGHGSLVAGEEEQVNLADVQVKKIVFPTKSERALWNYGSALARLETTTTPPTTEVLEALRDKAKAVTGVQDNVAIAKLASDYVHGTHLMGLRQAKGQTFVAPVTEEALKTNVLIHEQIAAAYGSGIRAGQVALKEGMPATPWLVLMQKYLQSWTTQFSPKAKIVILGEEQETGTRARTWKSGGIHFIYVPRDVFSQGAQAKMLALYTLAHEFGHIIVNEHLNDPKYARQRDALVKEYGKYVAMVPYQTAQELTEAGRSPADELDLTTNPLAYGRVPRGAPAQQLVNAYQQGYVLNFDEWLADQMVRYFHTNKTYLQIPNEREFWKPLFDRLKLFFDRIVNKFAPSQTYANWIEGLGQATPSTTGLELSTPRIDRSQAQQAFDNVDVTLSILDKLPKRQILQKSEILGLIGEKVPLPQKETKKGVTKERIVDVWVKGDLTIRGQERDAVTRVLEGFPGQTVPRNAFVEAVLQQLVPLKTYNTDKWADAGLSRIDRYGAKAFTKIFNLPFNLSVANHFKDPKYFGHLRYFVDNGVYNVNTKEWRGGTWNVMELQSDLVQKANQDFSPESLKKTIENKQESIQSLETLRDTAKRMEKDDAIWLTTEPDFDSPDWETKYRLKNAVFNVVTSLGKYGDVKEFVDNGWVQPYTLSDGSKVTWAISGVNKQGIQPLRALLPAFHEKNNLQIAELENDVERAKESLHLNVKEHIEKLPTKWWELMLRKFNADAAKNGVAKVRVASADTAAQVEGWRKELDSPQKREIEVEHPDMFSPGVKVTVDGKLYVVLEVDGNKLKIAPQESVVATYGRTQGIYNRYKTEIPKFVSRAFGAKPVVDDRGHTWLEWEVDPLAASAPIQYYSREQQKEISQEPNDQFDYTLKVLDRLPKKPMVKKVTIYGELGRRDVRKEERELIGRIVKEFPGESVDRNLFAERVLGEIVPLRLVETKTYAEYGLSQIGWGLDSPEAHGVATTHIWEAPGMGFSSTHFREDSPDYWVHSRVADHSEWGPPTQLGQRRLEHIRKIVELQSDLEQHDENDIDTIEERATLEQDLEFARDDVKALETALEQIDRNSEDGRQAAFDVLDKHYEVTKYKGHSLSTLLTPLDETVLSLKDNIQFVDSAELTRIRNSLVNSLERSRARAQDIEAQLKAPGQGMEQLPKRWWELVLRHENTVAARNNIDRLWMATADTIAKVEGWPLELAQQNEFWLPAHIVDRLNEEQKTADPKYKYTGLAVVTEGGLSLEVVFGKDEREWHDFGDEDWPYVVLLRAPEIKKSYGRAQGIYNRYANDITRFVKSAFKAEEITDEKGNTWLEWQIDPLFQDLPITYYSLNQAVDETGNQIAARAGVPELPATFTRFQGFLQSILQLNQLAKLLPQVEGLQLYRRAMRSMHALKARLFEGPNERIHEWHKLGNKQAKLVEQALRDEQLQGEHWTELRQVEAEGKKVWVHVMGPQFQQLMDARGISAMGRDLFLGVKNDYLSTLQAMEDVVRKHTEKFFAENPDVQAVKLAAINEEFTRLRQSPYLPDMRFGNWSVQVFAGHEEEVDGRTIKKGERVYWEKFESKRDRDRRLNELNKQLTPQGHKVSGNYDAELVSALRGLPQSVSEAVIEALNSDESTRLTPAQMEALKQIEFDQTAAGKFAKYLRTPAKHIGGASKDMRRAYAAYHWKTANAIAKLSYYPSLTSAMNSVRTDSRTIQRAGRGGVSDSYDRLVEYMQKNLTYVMNPQHEFEQLRMFASLWYLWGSTKTAVMNLTSVPVLSYPYLAARFGDMNATGSMLRAMKDVVQYWRDPTKLPPDKVKLLEKLKADGVTDQSFASMLASVSDGGVAFEKMIPQWEWLAGGNATNITRRTMWQVTSLGMMPFRVIEQLNRQVTGLAAYDLKARQTGKTLSTGDLEAYEFARDATEYTQNEYGAWNRPPMMRGKTSIFLLFFSFVQNMSFLMFGGDKSWWRALMVIAALAGLQGIPGADNAIDMFNWALRKITGDYVDLRTEARQLSYDLGANPDLVMHGITHNWLGLGWDTSTSVGAGRVIPGTDAIFGVGKFEQRFLYAASEVGGPVGSLMIGFLQAIADENPNELLRWDKALPPVLRNIEKAYLAKDLGEWVNQRGRPLATDPTGAELVGQALGFAPTRRTERSEELRNIKDTVTYYSDRRTNLLEMYYSARKTRDSEVMAEVKDRISEFNRNAPSPSLRINGEDLSRSMRQREKLDAETRDLKSPMKRYRDIYRSIDELY